MVECTCSHTQISLTHNIYTEILPLIRQIVNYHCHHTICQKELKLAAIRPLFKKANLELIIKNSRPISNLPFLRKVIAKVAFNSTIT